MSIDVAKPDLKTLMPDNAQFLIPLYQRPYEWGMANWRELWEDLDNTYKRRKANSVYSHFFGPVVTINFQPLIPQLVNQQHLVDGQQRITTITLLAKALFDVLGEDADADYQTSIRSLFQNNSENQEHKPKVVPGKHDKTAYLSVMGITPEVEGSETLLERAYTFFSNKETEWRGLLPPLERKAEVHLLFMTLTKGFSLVQIGLGPNESCYEIFNSLNRKGTSLLPADEVRNYCFMLLAVRGESNLQEIYDTYWHPMERLMISPDGMGDLSQNLSDYLRGWGTLRLGEQFAVRNLAAYLSSRVIEQRAKEIAANARGTNSEPVPKEQADAAEEFTKEIYAYSIPFRRMRWPQTISDPGEQAVCSRLENSQLLGVAGAADPLVLFLLKMYDAKPGNMDGFIKCMRILESYTVRRTLAGISGKQNNRVFAGLAHSLYEHVQQNGQMMMTHLAAKLQELLLAKTDDSDDRWPNDIEVRDGMRTARLYKNSRSLVKNLLIAIERNLDGHTQTKFSSYEVEHIMPNELTEEWSQELGANAVSLHDRLKNTIGNLVLLTHEEQIAAGQKRLNGKKTVYAESTLLATKWVCNYDSWGENQIFAHSDWFYEQIRQLWPRPVTI